MKCPSVSKLFCRLAIAGVITASMAQAATAMTRTQIGSYDLATDTQRLYDVQMTATATGAKAQFTRPDDANFTLNSVITTCLYPSKGNGSSGFLHIKQTSASPLDPLVDSFFSFAKDNNLHIFTKPLTPARHLFIEQDSSTLMVVDPAMMTMSDAGCHA